MFQTCCGLWLGLNMCLSQWQSYQVCRTMHGCSCLGMCVSRSSQDKKLVSPVFAAHMLSSGLPFELRDDYGGNPLPSGEQPPGLLYEHLQFYVDKVRVDLKNIGEWDRSLQQVI